MHEHGLARELWPQLKRIAHEKGFSMVTGVEMVVGMLHGVTAEFLAHSFEHAFEGTGFEGASVKISIVDPGEQFTTPGQDDSRVAGGWELLVVRMEGET